jgi:hypothetical protein
METDQTIVEWLVKLGTISIRQLLLLTTIKLELMKRATGGRDEKGGKSIAAEEGRKSLSRKVFLRC